MKNGTKLIAVLLCVLLLIPTMAFAETQSSLDAEIAQSAEGMSALGGKKGELLKDQEQFPAGTSVCDWLAMAMALSGAEESYADYLQALRTYVENAYAKNGCLDKNKATEYHRIALTVMALGGDPTDFGTKPDGSAIDLIAEGTYNYARDPGAQGLNGWIWALIALDAQDTEVPADAQYSREDMVSAIVIAQEPDGGFGLIPGKSDVDITAMAVQALAPYRDRLETEIDAALDDRNVERFALYLRNLCDKTQFIVITHRLANVTGADSIYVLEAGTVAGHGPHAALLAQGGLYKTLWDRQQELEHFGTEEVSA